MAYHVRQVDEEEIAEAEADLRNLVAETPTSALAYGLARVNLAENRAQLADAIERFPEEVGDGCR